MEVRGIGIINVPAMFGIRSIRTNKRVDLVVDLKPWEQVPDIERLGMEEKTVELLGVRVPHIVIPVRPARDLARLVEVAALPREAAAYRGQSGAGVRTAPDPTHRGRHRFVTAGTQIIHWRSQFPTVKVRTI